MEYIVFEDRLKELCLNKKEFAELSGLPYQTVMNWSNTKKTPVWVSSWLENYRKAHKFDIIHKLFDEEIGREKED